MAPNDVVQLGHRVEVVVVVVVEDVLQAVLLYLVVVEATFQFVLTTSELSHRVQLTYVHVFLKQNPQ